MMKKTDVTLVSIADTQQPKLPTQPTGKDPADFRLAHLSALAKTPAHSLLGADRWLAETTSGLRKTTTNSWRIRKT
jgi:hypothetical protein